MRNVRTQEILRTRLFREWNAGHRVYTSSSAAVVSLRLGVEILLL